eukprot:TRINITY_DN6384_c0_g1_i2.p2 TRINITY_DN6384_c0_g1~~TRINITY_DN6384_c0_g1_i2.p2  ORF type:complete len:165 (+),score=15.46 TRINITY_DN6384_c0_g1_i2:528-1022(+)
MLTIIFREKLGANINNSCVVALSAGGARRARRIARRLELPFSFIDERHDENAQYEVVHVVGEIMDYCIIVDDLIDTGGSIIKAAKAVIDKGAKHVFACATHGLLTGDCAEKLQNSPIEEVIITNTVLHKEELPSKIVTLCVSHLLGEAIRRIHNEESLTGLYSQ